MDQSRGNGDDNVGIPDDLRCKRSDGKQWRCTAMSMPDKTVCEKHYIQAKKRAANSALRASLKKAKRKPSGDSDVYLESKSDDLDMSLVSSKGGDYLPSVSGKKTKDKGPSNSIQYSPEVPHLRSLSSRNALNANEDSQRGAVEFEDSWVSYKTPPLSGGVDSSRSKANKGFDAANSMMEYSDQSTDSSEEDTGGQTCHQCRRNDRDKVVWCTRCDRRGYCDICISTWYSNISLEDIGRICPACRGTCNCKVCLRGDNMIKIRIREIPVLDKLQYLHCLLSSVLPVVKRIHHEQCFEVELEKRLRGTDIDLTRSKLNADEQMCCNLCRIPIIDYHRRCANCSYDLCLNCCQDLREASACNVRREVLDNQIDEKSQVEETEQLKVPKVKLNLPDKFPDWKANSDGSIPCPPKGNGGCGYSLLNLSRIFKTNWVAKLVKNVEEMVSGCTVNDCGSPTTSGMSGPGLCQYAHRKDSDDNFLYSPASQDIKAEGIGNFRKHWAKGEPIIVKQVFDSSSFSSWDPVVMWKGIRETTDEKMKDENRLVKAIDCLDWSEVDVELGQFIKGYSEGRLHRDGWPEMLKLKDWPSPSASEEFLLYHRPEFISKLPLLEYIHSKWGLLNVAAKLPHYSLQNDVGPKILISYGIFEELGRGDSVTNLHCNMRDMVYLLVHTCEVKLKGLQKTINEKIETPLSESEVKESLGDSQTNIEERRLPELPLDELNMQNASEERLDVNKDENLEDQGTENTAAEERLDVNKDENLEDQGTENTAAEERLVVNKDENLEDQGTENTAAEEMTDNCGQSDINDGNIPEKNQPGVLWDVFRRQDAPKLIEYMRMHWKEFGKPDDIIIDSVTQSLCEEAVFLNRDHKKKLKEEFGVEPWSFEQTLGQAVFLPAGCPFQVRNLQSNVQLGLDFLSPESMGEAVRLAEEIRCLSNDREAKLQVVEVGKISLYAASSAIKEVQKLVLDPKLGAELGFEDPNLTAMVSDNLEKMDKRRQTACA